VSRQEKLQIFLIVHLCDLKI